MAAVASLGLVACAGVTPEMAAQGVRPHTVSAPLGSATPRPTYARAASTPVEAAPSVPRYKLGAPYQAGGLWYVPAEEPAYDEVGVASWYGDQFDSQATANGERFDMWGASAAHTTLPLPSILEVTNLENGRTIQVRLNDRGPFKSGRILDLSRGAAKELGFLDQGTAKVRVRYVGPAKLDGTMEPLYVAQKPNPAGAQTKLAALTPPPAPAATIASTPLAPLAPAKPAPAVTTLSTAEVSGFAVQAGAFSDKAKAERIAGDLSKAGPAAVRSLQQPERTLYRVVLGPWRDASLADAARAQAIALGYTDARVVKAF